MEAKFSNKVKEVLALSKDEALRLGNDSIGTEHILLGMIKSGEGLAIAILKKLGISLDDVKKDIEHIAKSATTAVPVSSNQLPLTRQTEKMLKITYL